jgi:hypothetical protein
MLSDRRLQWVLTSFLAGTALRVQAQNIPTQLVPAPAVQDSTGTSIDDSKGLASEPGKSDPVSNEHLSFSLELTQNIGAKRDVDTTTGFEFGAIYKPNKQLTWSATQRLTKLYFIEPGEREVQVADTSLGLSYRLLDGTTNGAEGAKTGVSLGSGLTLPLSQYSSEQKLTTVASISASVTQKFGLISALIQPFFRYHLNQYKTLLKDDTGTTVIRYRLGLLAELSAELPFDLGLSASGQWAERAYENPPYSSNPPDHDYAFRFVLSYSLNEKTELGLGYSQATRAEQLGNVDIYLFDAEATQYYVSALRKF